MVKIEVFILAINDIDADEFTVTAGLSGAPEEAPEAEDFTVVVELDGDAVEVAGDFAWDAEELEATWLWSAFPMTDETQEVTGSVAYLETDAYALTIEGFESAAEAAVAAYEEVVYEDYNDWVDEGNVALREAATDAIALVEDVDAREAFAARVLVVQEPVWDAVEAVNAAATQAGLLTALQSFFVDVDADRILDYRALVNDTTHDNNSTDTPCEIQINIVWTSNVVFLVEEAATQIQLLNALNLGQDLGVFTGVNAD